MSTISLFYLDPLIVGVNSRADDAPRERSKSEKKSLEILQLLFSIEVMENRLENIL